MMTSLDWSLVEAAAEKLGVKDATLKKWRQRGIPHRWRIPLVEETKGAIGIEHFKETRAKSRGARKPRRAA